MNLNLKIIEGVKQFTSLHDNCGDLDERNHAWVKLAEKLNMNVQVLQIRWHSLLQLYQRDNNFKYANKMQFIHRSNEENNKVDNWPEFVITEECLKDYNNDDLEQFIYLESDEENNCKSIKPSQDNDCNYNEVQQKSEKLPDKDITNKENAKETEEELSSKKSQIQDGDTEIIPIYKSKEPKKEEIAAIDVNKSNKSFEETNEISCKKPPPLIGERCEDVIFGELVSAMLKRMDENKKKSIKKEIMNLLFS